MQHMGKNQVPDLKAELIKRDRMLALRFVKAGGGRHVVKAIHNATGVSLRTIYRAIERQGDWAKAYVADSKTE